MLPRHMVTLLLLATLGAALCSAAQSFAQPSAPQTDASIFLPLVSGARAQPAPAPPTPTPTPPAPARTGFFALSDWQTYNAATFVDAAGRSHLAFYTSNEGHANDPRGNPAYYTSCPAGADCAAPENWQPLVAMDSNVNEVQVVATSDGRPRLLVRRTGARGEDYDFWACEASCSDGQSWSGLFVTEAAGVELNNTRMPQRSFALDSQGRPRFVWSNSYGNSRRHGLYYSLCDAADCTQLDTWQHALVDTEDAKTVTADYATLVFDGDRPRVLTRINHSGLPVALRYYSCDEPSCLSRIYWGWQTIRHPEGKQWAGWDLALDRQGRPRLALYEAAGIDLGVGGKLFYAWCDTGCQYETPFSLAQIASGEGQGVDLAIGADGRMHLVYDAGQRGVLAEAWCDSGCDSAGAWQRRVLKTSAQLSEDLSPASPLTCSQQERAWFDAIPQATFGAQGELVVAYDATNYARCYTVDPSDPSRRIYSEVKRIWWGVRWDRFQAQP